MDPQGAIECSGSVAGGAGGQRRYVVGALCYRYHESAPGFPAVVLGYVLPDDLGHCDVCWDHRPVPGDDVPVYSRTTGHLDLRGARGSSSQGGPSWTLIT